MYQQIVILTGAGISVESGLSTFRAQDGLWENHRIEDVATPEGYQRNPSKVEAFYNARIKQLNDNNVQPNAAHLVLAKLEQEFKGKLLVVTQNVDDLHERAGTKNLLHMHGELRKGRCSHSSRVYDLQQAFGSEYVCECCEPPQPIRPHIVWFGEIPLFMQQIEQALAQCDLFISIGTSGTVYPAAGFVELAKSFGAQTVEINLEETSNKSQFDLHLKGKATELVPKIVNDILQNNRLS